MAPQVKKKSSVKCLQLLPSQYADRHFTNPFTATIVNRAGWLVVGVVHQKLDNLLCSLIFLMFDLYTLCVLQKMFVTEAVIVPNLTCFHMRIHTVLADCNTATGAYPQFIFFVQSVSLPFCSNTGYSFYGEGLDWSS